MWKKCNDILAGVPMTAVGGVCLVFSFVLPRAGIRLPADPAWAAVVISGIPLVYLAVWRIVHNPGIRKISSALLISIAMFAAIAIGDLFAAGEVAFIMAVGAILEDMTTERAKKGLKKLIGLAPAQGRLLTDRGQELILAEKIQAGDRLRVLPGESIPVDGLILAGETSVDQSIMTGESLPADKGVGDEVFCGTINRYGTIDIRATKVGEDSSLQKLIRLVQEAEEKQAPMQRIADRWASILVPVALGIAVAAGIITRDIVRAVTVLVVFCPCALVLATPTAIMAAIGQAAKHGVIIKSGEALERMGSVDTIAFDKTGTLTLGTLAVSDILPAGEECKRTDEEAKRELLRLAAGAEAKSEHPLAKAIIACAQKWGIAPAESERFQMWAGRGIAAVISGKKVLCGNEDFLAERGIVPEEEVSGLLDRLRQEGKATVLVACNGRCMGVLGLADVIRPQTAKVAGALAKMQVKTVLLTGDNQKAAAYFSGQAGIAEVYAGLLPEEKLKKIRSLQEQGRRVCMIGDGVNDAPALKSADVGVAMGSMGSDIAVEAADIALMSDDLSRIPYLKRLANATVRTIRFGITLSMCINFAAVTLSVLGMLTPTTGALVHNAGSCLVVLIAALLYDRRFD